MAPEKGVWGTSAPVFKTGENEQNRGNVLDFWGELRDSAFMGVVRHLEHKKNEQQLGKEAAARIKREKYEQQRRRDMRSSTGMGILGSVIGFCLYIGLLDSSGAQAFSAAGYIGGAVVGVVVGWLAYALWLKLSDWANPYKP